MLAIIGLFAATASRAASLDPAVLPKIQAATFEVIAAKPVNDPLTYEKPLPLDLLPFQARTDKYYSIGTAFAIGDNRYVTAGHVLLAGVESLWGPPELRDASGHVYPIGKIEKFSLRKDFVVFSLATLPPATATLKVDSKPALNQTVYSVGNALGTGVVIRDGLYTSNTPEEQDGNWKWMRFSAAASPGNSGGPLLDKDGKLIGVVLMKSQNENLNYALPISEVLDAPDGEAVMDKRVPYQLDIFDTIQSGTFKAQLALPMSLGDFYRNFQARFDEYSDKQLKALLARESANLFPKGAGSARLLYQPAVFNGSPTLIMRRSDGEWTRVGQQSRHFDLSGDGYVDAGTAGRNGLFHLGRSDNVDATAFYADAKLRMDLLAKTGLFQRTIAGEKIKITSLGKPTSESIHIDRWRRPWKVDIWPLPYANALVVVYSLPVPDGCAMLMRLVPTAHAHDTKLDLDELTSFVHLSYLGTLAQWKYFLKEPALQPAAFKNIHINFDYGHRFSYASQRVAFSYTPTVQAIAPDNMMWLGFSFFLDKGQPVWDMGDVDIWEKVGSDQNNVNIKRYAAPPAGLDDDLTSRWQKVSQRQYPYNAVARQEDDLMEINAVAAGAGGNSPSILYTAFYGVEGAHPHAEMKSKLDLLMKGMRVMER